MDSAVHHNDYWAGHSLKITSINIH